MVIIILEGVLFVALVAIGGALFYYAGLYFTPFGRRLRQIGNRRRIERAAALTCATHGRLTEDDLVRLPSGDRVCPVCYQEIIDGTVD